MTRTREWTAEASNPLTAVALVLVHSNVFISLAATCWVLTTVVLVDLPFDPLPFVIVFVVTLFVYSLNRFTDIDEDEFNVPGRVEFTKAYGRLLVAIGAVGYVLVAVVAVSRGVPHVELLLAPIAVIVAYSVVGLKRYLLVKNLIVGVAWGAIPLWVGIYYGVETDVEILVLTGFVVAMVTVAAVIFDLKDIVGDRHEGIRTVPRVVGPAWTRRGAVGASVVVGIALVAFVAMGVVGSQFLLLLFYSTYVIAYSVVADTDAGPLFYGFVVDGEHVSLAVVVLSLAFAGIL